MHADKTQIIIELRFSKCITCLAWFVNRFICLNEHRILWNENADHFTLWRDRLSIYWSSRNRQLPFNALFITCLQVPRYLESQKDVITYPYPGLLTSNMSKQFTIPIVCNFELSWIFIMSFLSRWSGDVMKRPGHKNFNAVSHNRSRPEVLFFNLTWRSWGQVSSVLLQLLLFAFSNRKFGRHGKWSVTFWQWENNT